MVATSRSTDTSWKVIPIVWASAPEDVLIAASRSAALIMSMPSTTPVSGRWEVGARVARTGRRQHGTPGGAGSYAARIGVVLPRMRVMPDRLLLLDGHSLAYRAFFALPVENFSTTTGQPTNAVYGFTAMLINVLRDEQPTHIAVAFDLSRKTFRSETYAEYKAGRSETPADFRGQVSLIREVLDALRIPSLAVDNYE